jgi:hypothetical protein
VLIALLVVCLACGAEPSPDSDVRAIEAVDSAGIRVVENRLPEGVAPVYAELGGPDLEIGVLEGEAAYQFTRVESIRGFGDGDVLVAEREGLELRVFDEAGTHMSTFGGDGGGPGEFARITDVGVVGDTVWAFDGRQRRVTLFRRDGTLLDTQRVGADQGSVASDSVSMSGMVEEHMWLFADGSWLNLRGISDLDMGISRSTAALITLPSELGPMDTLTTIPWSESVMVRTSSNSTAGFRFRFPRSGMAAAGPGGVALGWNAAYRIEYWSFDGTPVMVATAPDLEERIEADDVERERRAFSEGCRAAGCDEAESHLFSDDAIPSVYPAFSELLVDALDHVWVAQYEPPEDEPVTWHVFSPDGELLGRVAIPPGLEVHEIGEDFVLGVVTNELDVPFVRRYPLTRLR